MANTNTNVKKSGSKFLRQHITDTIQNIENVMTNIHTVLGDMGYLVQQIDIITEKLENKFNLKLKRPEVLLDANRNECDVIETPGFSNQSKITLPSPYLDYTYLELTNDCDVCVGNLTNFTLNEKYPLWIQYDTWKTENTVSDDSEVTAGSDSLPHSSDGCSKSWKSVSNKSDNFECYKTGVGLKTKTESHKGNELIQYSKCCKSKSEQTDKYCGVYEQMMEQQLEGIEPTWHDETGYDVEDSFSDDFSSDNLSTGSFSLSDEHVIHYNKVCNSWTSYKVMDITVRECSDSNSDDGSV